MYMHRNGIELFQNCLINYLYARIYLVALASDDTRDYRCISGTGIHRAALISYSFAIVSFRFEFSSSCKTTRFFSPYLPTTTSAQLIRGLIKNEPDTLDMLTCLVSNK